MAEIYDLMMADDDLVKKIRSRFERFQQWYLSATILPDDLFGLSYDPRCMCWQKAYPNESVSAILGLADGVLTRWEWLDNYYTPEVRRNFQKQSKKLRAIANALHETPYKEQALKIAESLDAEMPHVMMPECDVPMVKRERNFKTYAIRCIHKYFCDYLPIRTSSRGNEDAPWQTSPNREIAMIVTHLIGEETTSGDVTAALRSTRRKYYT